MYHAFLVQSYVKTQFYTKLLYKNDVFNGNIILSCQYIVVIVNRDM